MVVQEPGKVTERITLLGRRESNVYYLDGGSEAALIGGGMVYIAPDVIRQIRNFGLDEKKIRRIVILHSHFDHCGIVPFLRKKWPQVLVAASEPAKALLAKQKVIDNIHAMNRAALQRQHLLEKAAGEGFADFTGIAVDEVLRDSDKLSCGDLTLEILEVPGHSPCSAAVYVPEEKALFASDAGGIALGDDIFTAANSDFDQYQKSLEKMAALDVEICLSEHYGARTGSRGKGFLDESIKAAERFRKEIEQSLERTGDPDKTAEELTSREMQKAPPDFLPREIVYMINRQMAGFIFRQKNPG